MPGRVLVKDETEDQQNATGVKTRLAQPHAPALGASGAMETAGVQSSHKAHAGESVINGVMDTANLRKQRLFDALPPEIPTFVDHYQPLSKLFSRIAQECFNNLTETMAALSEQNEEIQVNGVAPGSASVQTSRQSAQKRLRWLDFANSHRDRFIKLLVILQWSRQVTDISKVIDVMVFLRDREGLYEQVDERIGWLKREMHFERIPSPDIETALEILSSGQSSRMPGLNYLPVKPLSASQLLKTLESINTLLHIRFNLHENLPAHFRTFRIASGRATFIVPAEFEVDLSIANEDPESQLWFIDFRFLFAPRSEIPDGQLRQQLENQANAVLAKSGLTGCYELLHDFVLTYKINILRRQASELHRTSWAGSLRIEQMHRSLIIQYWTERPGNKTWLEIGVLSGKTKKASRVRRKSSRSRLGIKWVRGAKEVESMEVTQLDNEQLDVSRILQFAVARHIQQIITSIREGLKTAGVSTEVSTDASDQVDSLVIRACSSRTVTLRLEPTTGRMILSPVTAATDKREERLNAHPDQVDYIIGVLIGYVVAEASSMVHDGSRSAGWTKLSNPDITSQPWKSTMATSVSHGAARLNLYKPWQTSAWDLAVLLGPSGVPSWWAVTRAASGLALGAQFQAIKLPSLADTDITFNHAYFSKVEDIAVALIALSANAKKLNALSVPFQLHDLLTTDEVLGAAGSVISIKVSALLGEKTASSTLSGDQVILRQSKVLVNDAGQIKLSYNASGRMQGSTQFLKHLTRWQDPNTTFEDNGLFSLQLQSALDLPCIIDQLRSRLATLSRLRSYLEIVRAHSFRCTEATTSRICFIYAKIKQNHDPSNGEIVATESKDENSQAVDSSTDLSVQIDFVDNTAKPTFYPHRSNPHHHARQLLSLLLAGNSLKVSDSDSATHAFNQFAEALDITLPVLSALTSLHGKAHMHIRDLSNYRLDYWLPRFVCNIHYYGAVDPFRPNLSCMWTIEEAKQSATGNGNLKDALSKFWKSEAARGIEDGVTIVGKGIACPPEHIAGIIERLDAVVAECEDGELDDGTEINDKPNIPNSEGNGGAAGDLQVTNDIPVKPEQPPIKLAPPPASGVVKREGKWPGLPQSQPRPLSQHGLPAQHGPPQNVQPRPPSQQGPPQNQQPRIPNGVPPANRQQQQQHPQHQQHQPQQAVGTPNLPHTPQQQNGKPRVKARSPEIIMLD